MLRLINDHWRGNRSCVSADTGALTDAVCAILGCEALEIPAGSECLTWIIPKRWEVRRGVLKGPDGGTVADFADNPLHLWTHSVAFSGRLSREALEEHLHSDPRRPDRIPYHYRNGYRPDAGEWGFSIPHSVREALPEGEYSVEIDADLDTDISRGGVMKVADHLLPGERPECLLFGAHTCHPAQVCDGLSNVAVLTALFVRLAKRPSRRWSYRFVAGPEYFAAAGWLQHRPASEAALIRGGIYTDMFGNGQPFGWQTSFSADSAIDRVTENVFDHHVPGHIRRGYRRLWGNDETFWNGCGVGVPTVGVACGEYPEYHFDDDDPSLVDPDGLERSVLLLERIIDVFETDFVPVPKFRGPVYLSRYGLYIAPEESRHGYDTLEAVQILMNGERSCFEIALKAGADFFFVRDFCRRLEENGLAGRRPSELLSRPPGTLPAANRKDKE